MKGQDYYAHLSRDVLQSFKLAFTFSFDMIKKKKNLIGESSLAAAVTCCPAEWNHYNENTAVGEIASKWETNQFKTKQNQKKKVGS